MPKDEAIGQQGHRPNPYPKKGNESVNSVIEKGRARKEADNTVTTPSTPKKQTITKRLRERLTKTPTKHRQEGTMEGIMLTREEVNKSTPSNLERDNRSVVSYDDPPDAEFNTDIFNTNSEIDHEMETITDNDKKKTRKDMMRDLEEAMKGVTEILSQMSNHAEFTTTILEGAKIITQRLTLGTDKRNQTGIQKGQTHGENKTTKNAKDQGTDHLAQIATSLAKLTTRMDQIESQLAYSTRATNQGDSTSRKRGEDRDEARVTEISTSTRPPQTETIPSTVTNVRAVSRPIVPKARNPATDMKKGKTLPTNPLAAHHPSRLIVEIQDGAPEGKRPKEAQTVQDINEQLQKYEDSKHIQVVNVKYNPQNNCIVFVRADQQATELIPFANRFTELIAGDRATRVRADRPWYKIQVNGVSTWNENTSNIPTPEEIHQELKDNNPDYAKMEILQLPRWMRHPSDLKQLFYSSVVIALANQEDAEHLVKRIKNLAIAGRFAETDHRYSNATIAGPSTTQGEDAKTKPYAGYAQECTEEQGEDPMDLDKCKHDYTCAACKGPHTANFRNCPVRSHKVGMPKTQRTRPPMNNGMTTGAWNMVTCNRQQHEQKEKESEKATGRETTRYRRNSKTTTDARMTQNRFQELEDEIQANALHSLDLRFPEINMARKMSAMDEADGEFAKAVATLEAVIRPRGPWYLGSAPQRGWG
ncbi:hypothetical protein AcV7_009152 [Taiwanofungus camphoratus]|nr:hypothetical protein AcV7_009152 [Antrodia cinnamomea]